MLCPASILGVLPPITSAVSSAVILSGVVARLSASGSCRACGHAVEESLFGLLLYASRYSAEGSYHAFIFRSFSRGRAPFTLGHFFLHKKALDTRNTEA